MEIYRRGSWCSAVLAVLATYGICTAQNVDYFDPTGAVRSQLENAVATRFGSVFVWQFAIMDSLLAHGTDIRHWPREAVTDPFGSLRGCIFFSARKSLDESGVETDSCITGVYKNGQIIWDNYPGSKDCIGWSILTAKDMNQDGQVDILTPSSSEDFSRTNGDNITFLSVLTWDGIRGRFINDVNTNPEDAGGAAYLRSKLISEDGTFETLDADGDGIFEIRGQVGEDWLEDFPAYRTTTSPYVTYGWNGSKYGLWASVRQVPRNEFLPANRLSVSVKCIVLPTDSGLVYSYTVSNDLTSRQRIQRFFVTGFRQFGTTFAPPSWIAGSATYIEARVFSELSLDGVATIAPGESKRGFGMSSTGLPSVVQYYVQGLTAGTPMVSDEERRNDILKNSVTGYTVGVLDTARPPVTAEFLDTLTSYTTQSRSLGWIKDQPTADKYLGYFSTAKAQLKQHNSTGARVALQSVLRDVDVDSSSTLTSEAYALLRHNTEYLLDQLPAQSQEPPFVVQVDSLSARLTTAHANGWIGDRGFTNSLNKQLTDARKSLEKGSLTRASTQLQDFLNRLQKVYRHTLEEQQKGKRRPKNFVTEEGFTFLAGKTTELLKKLGSLGEILNVPGQFTTIQAAVNAAKPGATIEVDAGTYKELVEIQKKDSLTLLASEDVTIQGVRIARSNVITVKGFTIDAAGTKRDAVEIEGQENTDITIEANEITNSSKHGISAGKHNVRTRIVNNVIAGNEKNGIDFADGTDGAQYVLNNTIVKNGWNGVEAASQKNLYLVNNIISFNGTAKGDAEGRYGVKRDGKAGAGKIVLLNNLIIGNDGKVNKQSSKDVANYDQVLDGTDSGNITSTGAEGVGVSGSSAQSFGDVLLADYRLAKTSVAIDKGTVSFAAPDAEAGKLPEEDKDGNPRPQGTSIALGAFELE